MSVRSAIFRLVFAVLALMPLAVAPAAARDVAVGVLAYRGALQTLSDWTPTVEALDRALPGNTFQLVPLDHAGLRDALAAGKLDFVITNSGSYVELESRFGISRIATLQSSLPVASTVITLDPDLKNLGDLAGKRLAIADPDAFGGFQVIWRELKKAGVDPLTDLALVNTGLPMARVVTAVLAGNADAGVIRGCMLEELSAKDPATFGRLMVVAPRKVEGYDCLLSSQVYPDWPFAKTKAIDPAFAKKVAIALLALPSEEGKVSWTVPLDYQPVHDLFKELKIGPYASRGRITLAEVFRQYHQWFVIAAMGLVGWFLYMVRVEHLVRQRTRALSKANEDLKVEMTERKRIEETDRLHRRELEHVARLSILGEMVGNLAHELNQPLAAIASYAQGCAVHLKRGTLDSPQMLDVSSRIAEQAERAATVIQRIRAFVRKRESQPEVFAFNDLPRECSALFEAVTRQAGVATALDLADDVPDVEGDRVHLQQVVLNLVQNAIDAMADLPADQKRIVITTSAVRGGACLTVRDWGTGLSDEALERYCEPFYTTKPEGLGLGLALSRSIMEAHGGHLAAERLEGGGTAMHMWLPPARAAEAGNEGGGAA